uniref:SGNH hydrolase-type esterase domain-containing protein n=1 Tax=Noctiluca scintillans TaxID=2966 RepID=A0A7S1FBH5_NOCSC
MCYGDSNTAGFNAGGQAYDPYAQAMTEELRSAGCECTVRVCGLSGLTARDMVEKSSMAAIPDVAGVVGQGIEVLLVDKPDLVILMTGTNDIGQGMHPRGVLEDICTLHTMCHAQGIPTVAIGPPMVSKGAVAVRRDELASLLGQWARETPLVDVYADIQDLVPHRGPNTHWDKDDLHFSPAGSAALGVKLAREVLRWLPHSCSRLPERGNDPRGLLHGHSRSCVNLNLPGTDDLRGRSDPPKVSKLHSHGPNVTVRPHRNFLGNSGGCDRDYRSTARRFGVRHDFEDMQSAEAPEASTNAGSWRREAELRSSCSDLVTPPTTARETLTDVTGRMSSRTNSNSFLPLPRTYSRKGSFVPVLSTASTSNRNGSMAVKMHGAVPGPERRDSPTTKSTGARDASLPPRPGSQTARRSDSATAVDMNGWSTARPGRSESLISFATQRTPISSNGSLPPQPGSQTARHSDSATAVEANSWSMTRPSRSESLISFAAQRTPISRNDSLPPRPGSQTGRNGSTATEDMSSYCLSKQFRPMQFGARDEQTCGVRSLGSASTSASSGRSLRSCRTSRDESIGTSERGSGRATPVHVQLARVGATSHRVVAVAPSEQSSMWSSEEERAFVHD